MPSMSRPSVTAAPLTASTPVVTAIGSLVNDFDRRTTLVCNHDLELALSVITDPVWPCECRTEPSFSTRAGRTGFLEQNRVHRSICASVVPHDGLQSSWTEPVPRRRCRRGSPETARYR